MDMKALVSKSYLTLCDPMDCSPPGFSVHGILQARTLEWFTIPFSRGSSWLREWTQVSSIADRIFTICATTEDFGPWAAAAAAKSLQSCPTLRPHRWQRTRCPHPWDSLGKNTGVGCHFLLQCMKVKSESEVDQSCPTLLDPMTAAYQAPPPMGFSRYEYWSGVQLPSPMAMREGSSPCFSPWFIDCPNPTVPHIIFTYVYLCLCLYLTFSLI